MTVHTETQQVELRQPENLPRYAQMETRQTGEPLNPNLKPKNP
ncbi:hypothetical protein [Kingella kingae]|nr:hypothetical protein [Kingella kingae]